MKKLFLLSYISFLIPYFLFSQNVGIGTTNPNRAKLELHGAVDATTAIFGGETTGISLQRNWPGIGFNSYWNAGDKYIANGYAAKQHFDPGSGYMYIDMYGNGIANSSITSQARAITISNTGNIGLRTAPANASLYAVKAGNFEGTARFGEYSNYSYFNYGVEEHTYIRPGFQYGYVYINDIPGNIILGGGNSMVGINSANPTYTLEIGQINNKGLLLSDPAFNLNDWEYRVGYLYSAPQSDLRLYYNGVPRSYISADDGQYRIISSDSRIKTNIKPLASVLDRVNLLQPSVYEMKDHNENHEKTFGFIAQDVKPLFPELVIVKEVTVDSVNHIPDLHGLNYTAFSIISIKALQEQYLQIQALHKEQEVLLQRLEVVNKKIDAQKSDK